MPLNRRELLASGAAAIGGLAAASSARAQHGGGGHEHHAAEPARAPAQPARGARGRVVTPNNVALPWRRVNGVKVFHLVAEPIVHEPLPGVKLNAWGYNGRTPGPTIEVEEGDRVRIYVTNKLPAPTTVHWHGVILPNGMDGVGGLTQPLIPVGRTFVYEFRFDREGTFMYHPHVDEMTQIGLGLMGMIVVHPRRPRGPQPARDYALLLNEWSVPAGMARPDILESSDFNILTINGMSFPETQPLLAQVGERVRIRIGNLSPMQHHPIHLHGHSFEVVETDGGRIPPSARWPETTVLVPVGAVRTIELVAGPPGDWALHCHMTHHMMNQMGHARPVMVGMIPGDLEARLQKLIPGYMSMGTTGMVMEEPMEMPVPENSAPMLTGPGPFGLFDMAGMFTLLKVRERLPPEGEVGWYDHPRGTVAHAASPEQARADGIDLG